MRASRSPAMKSYEGVSMKVQREWGGFAWVREPIDWEISPEGQLRWRTRAESDFWRNTGGVVGADDGDAFLLTRAGDFSVTMMLGCSFNSPYDQCGLMVRADDRNWVKAGLELDGGTWFSVVETHENSDWSKQEWLTPSVEFRVWRSGDTLRVGVVNARGTQLVRELIFDGDVAVGPYSCAPKGAGFDVTATASLTTDGELTINAQAGSADALLR